MSSRIAWWEHHLLNDAEFGDIRLKTLKTTLYLTFKTAEVVVDQVSINEFLKMESDRLPLVVGTQFGLFPRLNEVKGFFLEPRIVALLSKSALSGNVAGLSICLITDNTGVWKVIKDFPEQQLAKSQKVITEINVGRDFGCVLESGKSLVIK